MKKLLAFILTLAMVLTMTACGGDTQDGAADDGGEGGESVTLALSAGSYAASSVMGQALNKLAELIEEYSGGTVTCDVYTDGSLGDITSQVDAVISGSIDILCAGDSYYSTYVPEMQIFELPFLYESVDEARYVLDGEAGQAIADLFDGTGLQILDYWEIGMRQFTNNVHPVTSMEDVQGLRLRVLPVEIQVYAWEQFGCQVVAIDGSELYSSLQTGVVDAQENPLEGIYSNKIFEVQKYITMTNHVFTPAALSISDVTVEKLSDEQMEAVRKAVDEATDWFRDALDENEQVAYDALSEVCEICDDPDLSGFVEASNAVYEEFSNIVPDTESYFDLIYAARDEYRSAQ